MAELPQIEAEAVSSSIDLSRSAGAAERATAEMFGEMARTFGDVTSTLDGVAKTVNAGELAKNRNAVDGAIDEIGTAHNDEPAAFQSALGSWRTEYLKAVPSRFAVQMGQYIDEIGQREHTRIARGRVTKDWALGINDQQARLKIVSGRISDRLGDGLGYEALQSDPTMHNDVAEFDAGVDALVQSRALAPAEAELMKADARGLWKAASFAHGVSTTLREGGYEAALGLLRDLEPTPWKPAGMVSEPTIDIHNRPEVRNADGSISTVRSISIEQDGQQILIPTVVDGAIVSNEAAIAHFRQSGAHLGIFDTAENAAAAGQSLHAEQAAEHGLAGNFTPRERELAYAKGLEVLEREHGLATRQAAAAQNMQVQQRRELTGRITDDIGRVEFSGRGNGLTQEEILQSGGDFGDVMDWLTKKAAAQRAFEQHGNLAMMRPEERVSALAASATFASGPADFRASVNFVIDGLEGGATLVENDNGRGPSRFGVNAAANPDLDVRNLTRDQAVARYKARYWDPLGLDTLPSGLALVAFDAAVNQGPEKAKRWIAESGGDVGRYLQLRTAEYQRLAKADPGRYGDDLEGWIGRLRRVAGQAAAMGGAGSGDAFADLDGGAWANARAGFASDPINFVRERGIAPVQPLPDYRAPGFGQALQARLNVALAVSERYAVPKRTLTTAEAKFISDTIDQDPAAGIQIARTALGALGPEAAAEFLREVGQTGQGQASTQLHIADMAAGGSQAFALTAAQGLTLKADGRKLEERQAKELDEAFAANQRALGAAGAVSVAARNVAEAAMLADQARGVAKSTEYYVNSALGGTRRGGQRFGGPVEVNGGPTIAPRWLASDRTDDALMAFASNWEARGKGPVYANGKPMPARDVAKMRLTLMPNGRYRLVTKDGRAAMARNGAAFEVDFDAGREFLRRTLGPTAVFGGS